MKFFTFLRLQMSEPDGSPSNNRVMLFLFLTTITGLILGVVLANIFKPGLVVKLPEIPPSFESLVEWVTGILVTGGALGKAANAYSAAKGAGNAISGGDKQGS